MSNISDFYDKLDLRYPEIAIAIEDIYRPSPGRIKFIIPILTPIMDNSKIIEKTAYQTKYNLRNENKNLEVNDIRITNYIEIPVPAEICQTYNNIIEPDICELIIPKGSKWIVVFIGGDITKPRVISRYLD